MKGLSGLYDMASNAEGAHVADEFGILKACMFFIGYFSVAVKAGLFKNFIFGIQLPVGVVSLVLVFIVALETDASHGLIWCAP